MPIYSEHSTYTAHKHKWARARDASAGQDAVHAKGETYLPKIDGWSDEQYSAYKTRAAYYNASGRTVDALVGMVFRKEPIIEHNGLDNIIDDVDLFGNSIQTEAQAILRELLTVSRVGYLVEYPKVEEQPRTQAEQSQQNLRPYISKYPSESIINWRMERINNVMQYKMVVLKESYIKNNDDVYAPEYATQYRELLLSDEGYIQNVWRKISDTWEIVETITPLMNNAALDFIPFYMYGCEENSIVPIDAPLLPLVDLNLAHYRVNADYEHGCHVSGLPTLFVAGLDLEEDDSGNTEEVPVGASITAPNPDAHAEFVEVKTEFKALSSNLDKKERQMATLGARLLEQQKAGVETAEAMQIRSNGENSVLASIAILAGAQLSNMLTFMAEWAGSNQEVTVTLNTDFMPVSMTAQQLTALVQARQSNSISQETFFYNLQKGEIIQEGVSFEDEKERIDQGEPVLADADS